LAVDFGIAIEGPTASRGRRLCEDLRFHAPTRSKKSTSGLASLADAAQAFDPMLLVSRDLTGKRFRMTETQMRN
jgi:hypothetical protein